ncbi:MAG TPA: hypothetical protein HA362_01060 [Nanoarchaeota archaeon]|nr:hypothetical protein [Nanoarchaeota archaeon]
MKKNEDMCEERKLSPWPSALALGLASGVLYAVCAASVLIWPAGSVKFFSYWFHGIDLTRIANAGQLGFGSFVVGLVSLALVSMAFGAIFAMFYNMCFRHCAKRGWIK